MKASALARRLGVATLIAIAVGVASAPASAGVLGEGELFSFGEAGSGAGQIRVADGTGGIGTDSVSGHVFIADTGNSRIDEFTAWGGFVKSWGWGVKDGNDELQVCTAQTGCQQGLKGSGTGQLFEPTGIEVAPGGDVYVYEAQNHRLQTFDSDGNFVRSIGGDVVAHGPGDSTNDETQEVTIAASSGTFKLSFENPFGEGSPSQTAAIPYSASAAEVEAALNGLPTIGGLGGSVTVTGGPGNPTGTVPYEITFEGNLTGDDVPQLTIDRSALGPATIGARLVCSSTTEADSFTYQWLRNGTPIAGATAAIYVTTAADEGKSIQCLVGAYFALTGSVQATTPVYVAPPALATTPPVPPSFIPYPFSTELSVGKSSATIQCQNPAQNWSNATAFSYSWYHNGERIEGANAINYTATAADLAAPGIFQCGITASNAGGATTKLSAAVPTDPEPRDRIYSRNPPNVSMEPVRTLAQGGGPEICSVVAGDTCKVGRRGVAPGEFALEVLPQTNIPPKGDNVDIAPDGTIYVGDWARIQKFESNGAAAGSIPLTSSLWQSALPMPQALSLTPEGDILVAFRYDTLDTPAPAYRLSGGGVKVYELPTTAAPGLAAGANGVSFAIDVPIDEQKHQEYPRLLEIGNAGQSLAGCCILPRLISGESVTILALATNVVTAAGGIDLYSIRNTTGINGKTVVQVLGTPPDKWLPPIAAPEIDAQYARSVGEESAVLGADVNPVFWADTHYHVEYGTSPCSSGGCETTGERQLGAGVVRRGVATDGVVISGLTPATTYHYRFVAQSGGGGPVYGPDRAFTTFAAPKQADSACSNQELRTGPSSTLPDCRAYEMVSPVDKEGADLSTFVQINGYPARLDQSAPSGNKVTYSASAAFGDTPAGAYSAQYLSTRGQAGWGTRSVTPPQESGSILRDHGLDVPFKAFNDDLSSGWLVTGSGPQLAAGGLEGFGNLYRRDNQNGTYEAITTVTPPGVTPGSFYPTPLGASIDGTRTFFRAQGKLTPDATSSTLIDQVYEAHEGELHLVSVKPNGSAATASSTIGGPVGNLDNGRESSVATAVSEDGRLVYWTEEGGFKKLYLRIEGAETVAVSGPQDATFWLASPDGERALYTEGGRLRRFDQATRQSTTLATGDVRGVLGASDDLSRVYFAAGQALAPGAVGDKPNLYLYEDGAPLRFIATLASEELPDVNTGDRVPPVAGSPLLHFARVTPDGEVAIFMSRQSLTGADSIDRATGEADAQVFRYEAQAGELACISCAPTGARPAGAELNLNGSKSQYFYAAKIPGAELQFHASRVLSSDGDRVFFDSVDRLVSTDTNGRSDVYQWEAEGKSECVGADARGYDSESGGCLTLISDGRGSSKNEFIDASADGTDVFFFTGTSLLPQDSGQIDVYDARVNGGFPQPPAPPAQCEGEACQPPLIPPSEPPNSSETYHGPGNPKSAAEHKKKSKKSKKKKKKAKRHGKAHRTNRTGGKR